MSKYCGKCDLWDTLVDIHELDDNSDWSKVYIYQNNKRLNINSLKDLIKYAPYIIGSMSFSKKTGEYHINICDESYITERYRLIEDESNTIMLELENYHRDVWYKDMIKYGYSEEEALSLSRR